MRPGEWHHGDGADHEGLPQDGQSERASAVDAAQQLLAGPSASVPRALLLQLTALLRAALRLLERVLDEGSTGTQPADDASATE
jgi:hypothetical protein